MKGVVATVLRNHFENLEIAEKIGANIVEIRLDREYIDPGMIKSKLPLIFTIRRESDGGYYSGDEKTRLELLEICGQYGAVDVETDCFEKFKGEGEFIISYHNLSKTPDYEELKRIVEDFGDYGVVKIAVKGREKKDVLTVLKLVSEYEGVVAFCLGKEFSFTRIASFRMGAPLIYSYVGDEEGGEGQIPLEKLLNLLSIV